jgi:hypothetical protein
VIDVVKNILHEYAPLVSFLLTTLVTVIIYLFRPKVKLIWGSKSDFKHIMRSRENTDIKKPKQSEQQPLVVHSAHYFIKNTGQTEAKNVEIVLNFPPDEISVWPQRQYGLSVNNENRQIIFLPFIGSKESLDILLLSVGKELPMLMNVKCPESNGRQVRIDYHRVLPKWIYFGTWSLIFLGVAFALEKLIKLFAVLWQ